MRKADAAWAILYWPLMHGNEILLVVRSTWNLQLIKFAQLAPHNRQIEQIAQSRSYGRSLKNHENWVLGDINPSLACANGNMKPKKQSSSNCPVYGFVSSRALVEGSSDHEGQNAISCTCDALLLTQTKSGIQPKFVIGSTCHKYCLITHLSKKCKNDLQSAQFFEFSDSKFSCRRFSYGTLVAIMVAIINK